MVWLNEPGGLPLFIVFFMLLVLSLTFEFIVKSCIEEVFGGVEESDRKSEI